MTNEFNIRLLAAIVGALVGLWLSGLIGFIVGGLAGFVIAQIVLARHTIKVR